MQPYPRQDSEREGRIIQDVLDLLHDNTLYGDLQADTPTTRKIKRWIIHVLNTANDIRKWWFLENVATETLPAGSDIIDLRGHIDKVAAVYAPKRLHKITLQRITELRMAAQTAGSPNAGPPTHYALEAGHRIHLWPAPAEETAFAVMYTRPMHVAIIPNSWETIVLNGIIGMFGRHFDRDALIDEPAVFETRFYRALKNARKDGYDVAIINRMRSELPAQATLVADSATDTGTDVIAPASLTGVGYTTIETGDYPLEIQ